MRPTIAALCVAACVIASAHAGATAQGDPANAAPRAQPDPNTVRLAGGLWLQWYQPVGEASDARSRVDVHHAYVTADKESPWGGVHVEARARDDRFRAFYASNVWLQEAYAFARLGRSRWMVGKFYRHLGGAPSGAFIGPLTDDDGLTGDPDNGIGVESTVELSDRLRWTREAQYFVHGDGVNNSLRDTLGSAGARDVEGEAAARERNTWVGRIALEARRGGWFLRPGVSVSSAHVERDRGAGNSVTCAAAELTMCREPGGLGTRVYANLIARNGRTASDYPAPGGADNALYWHAGLVKVGMLGALRYNVSGVTYRNTGVREIVHQPGLSIGLGRTSALYAEYVVRLRHQSDVGTSTLDKSVNVAVKAAL